jgi:hypothetical protein
VKVLIVSVMLVVITGTTGEGWSTGDGAKFEAGDLETGDLEVGDLEVGDLEVGDIEGEMTGEVASGDKIGFGVGATGDPGG